MILLQIPVIPDTVKSEGMSAVLFMVIIGVGVGMYCLRQLPAVMAAWRGIKTAHDGDTDRLIEAMKGQVQSNAEVMRTIERLIATSQAEMEEARALRRHNHEILTPAISGLTIAYLRLVALLRPGEGYAALADRIAQDNPDAKIP